MNIDKANQMALKHYQTGNLQQAEHMCKKILLKRSNNIDAAYLLGLVYCQMGNYNFAIKYFKKTVELNPSFADAYNGLGGALQAKKQLDEAITCYQKAIRLKPNFDTAYCNLGAALGEKGHLDESVASCQKALCLNPSYANAYYNLGRAFQAKKQLNEAMKCYQRALQLNPSFANAYNNLGSLLYRKGQLDEAMKCYQKALELNPDYAEAYCNLGASLYRKGQLDEAMKCYQKALELNPDYAEAYCNLGASLYRKGQLDEAIRYCQKALELNPDYAEAYYNLGTALQEKRQLAEAITCYQKALLLDPDYADAHWNMAISFLLSGNFKEGWEKFEWRWKLKDFCKHEIEYPRWNGSDISGLTILLRSEQGFGDTIQFIRYASLVAQRGAHVLLLCPKELASLLRTVEGIHRIFVSGEKLPDFDVHCPLLSLPLVFDTRLESVPAKIPYISADPVLVQKWRDRVCHDDSKLKIGLAWAGSPTHKNDHNRSISLDILSPLAQFDKTIIYSLQKGSNAQQPTPKGMVFVDFTEEINDFSDTAAFIENLDLIISVDTAVAHLAGAMGKPVWTLLPFAPDWRWMLDGDDSPWYPTMRLFRQPSIGDWESVISRLCEEIQKKIMEIKS